MESFITNLNYDLDNPFYVTHPEYGPSLDLYFEASSGEEFGTTPIYAAMHSADWVLDEYEWVESLGLNTDYPIYDTGSGIKIFGSRLISPLGNIYEALMQTSGILGEYILSGNWSNYMAFAQGECGPLADECEFAGFALTVPHNEMELGTYQSQWIIQDYAGNELIIANEELSV